MRISACISFIFIAALILPTTSLASGNCHNSFYCYKSRTPGKTVGPAVIKKKTGKAATPGQANPAQQAARRAEWMARQALLTPQQLQEQRQRQQALQQQRQTQQRARQQQAQQQARQRQLALQQQRQRQAQQLARQRAQQQRQQQQAARARAQKVAASGSAAPQRTVAQAAPLPRTAPQLQPANQRTTQQRTTVPAAAPISRPRPTPQSCNLIQQKINVLNHQATTHSKAGRSEQAQRLFKIVFTLQRDGKRQKCVLNTTHRNP